MMPATVQKQKDLEPEPESLLPPSSWDWSCPKPGLLVQEQVQICTPPFIRLGAFRQISFLEPGKEASWLTGKEDHITAS